MGSRHLVLMRHGKSGYPGGVHDHDRPLTDRGRSDAALAGRWLQETWLQETLPPIDAILCSTALRARQTATATGVDAPVSVAEGIYDATADEILTQIRATGEAVATLLLVGHAPGVPSLAFELAGAHMDPALDVHHFPTAAVAVLVFTGEWADLSAGDAELTFFHRPGA